MNTLPIHTCKYLYKIHNYAVCNTKYNYTQGVNGLTHLKNRAKMTLVAIFISKAGKMMHTIALEQSAELCMCKTCYCCNPEEGP